MCAACYPGARIAIRDAVVGVVLCVICWRLFGQHEKEAEVEAAAE